MIEKTAKVWLGGRRGVTAPIHVSQYDTGWRFLLSVYDGDAVYTGGEGTAVYMEGRKADGTVFAVPGAFVDGVAVVECTASITAAVGPIDCELRVSEDGETVGTANFEIIVEAAPLEGYVASGDDFSAMLQVLDGSSEAAADALAAKNAAAASAEAAAVSAATAQVQAGMAYQIAASAADMTDHSIGYVYVGNETGYTYGGWYYWDGTAWTLGGLSVDPTLTVAGAAADAKVAGDEISDLRSALAQTNRLANLIPLTYKNTTKNGITYTWSGNVCTLTGLSTAISYCDLLEGSDPHDLPNFLSSGDKLFIPFTRNIAGFYIYIFWYAEGASSYFELTSLREATIVNVPENAKRWMIRLYVPKDTDFTETSGIASNVDIYCLNFLDSTLLDNTKSTPANVAGELFYHNKNRNYNYAAGLTFFKFSDAGYSSTNPMKPSDLPKNSYTYILGNALDNTLFPLGGSTAGSYFLFRLSNTLSSASSGAYSLYVLYKLNSGNNWFGFTSDGGASPITWYKNVPTTNYNNTYEENTYENTYNVTCTPNITTDTNNFLAASGDTSDRSGDINAMLTATGVCRLGPGDFYISSSISVPNDGMLSGCGNSSKIIFNDDAVDVPAIIMNGRSIVENVFISGSTGSITKDGNLSNRHGIYWAGTATGGSSTSSTPKRGTIANVIIEKFTGAGMTLAYTGTNLDNCLNVVNCYIANCNAGINLVRYAEFNRFTNIHVHSCYYGAINNGGNNVFCNCSFSGNTCGMLMDNATGQSPNNSHGSIIGCLFDHSGQNSGYGLKIIGMNNGEIVQGCQFFFSKILIEDSTGVVFDGCNFGFGSATYGADIELTANTGNTATAVFAACMFKKNPQVSKSGDTVLRLANCYLLNGAEVTE